MPRVVSLVKDVSMSERRPSTTFFLSGQKKSLNSLKTSYSLKSETKFRMPNRRSELNAELDQSKLESISVERRQLSKEEHMTVTEN